jgi:hypothetical protein
MGLFDIYPCSIKNKIMEQFSKQIKVGKETRLFQFKKIEDANGVKFFITSGHLTKDAFACSMKQNKYDADWKLVPGSQRWLYEIEETLADAIASTQN